MKKRGFVFIETIVVIAVVLGSLLTVYSLYIHSNNTTTRRMRYDDVNRLYETYYIHKYLNSFNLAALKRNIQNGSKYEIIYRGRQDVFGTMTNQESSFFENLWQELHIRNIFLLPYNVIDSIRCTSSSVETICADKNLVNYLKTLDIDGTTGYRLVVEFATKEDGSSCTDTANCFYSFAQIKLD